MYLHLNFEIVKGFTVQLTKQDSSDVKLCILFYRTNSMTTQLAFSVDFTLSGNTFYVTVFDDTDYTPRIIYKTKIKKDK